MSGARMELTGSEAALARLGETLARTDDKRGLFQAIGMSLVTSTQHRFEREAGPDGNAWPASLRKLVSGGRTLTESGELVRSITFIATEDSLAVGTNVPYGAIHQLGGTIKAKTARGLRFRSAAGGWVTKQEVTIPARPFLGLDEDDREEITALCADWLGAATDGGARAPQ